MNQNALAKAADILGTTSDALTRFPIETQRQLIALADEPIESAFEQMQAIWQQAFLNQSMEDVSRVSGISMQTLKALPEDTKISLMYALAANPNDVMGLNQIVFDAVSIAALPDIAMLLKQPLQQLLALPQEKQQAICGCFDMLYGTIADEDLAKEILTTLEDGEAS